MKKKILMAGMLLCTAVYSKEIGLVEVLEKLKVNNYEIKSQEQEIEIKKLTVKKEFKKLFPGADFEVEKEILNNQQYKDGANVFGPQKVTAGINVYSGGKLVNNYKKVKKDFSKSEIDLILVNQDMEIKAIELYFEILSLNKQKEITLFAKDTLLKQEKRLDILFSNNKMVSKNELLEVKADIMSIDAELLEYADSIRVAKEKLFVLIGEDINSDYTFTEYNEEFLRKSREQLQMDIEKAKKEGNLALKKDLDIEKAELDVKIARAGFLPTIKLNVEYRLDDDIKYGDNHKDWGLEIEASMNVFQWGATLDDIDSKKIALERRELEKNNVLENLTVDIRSKYSKIEQLKKEITIAKERKLLLEESTKIQNIRFTNGMLSSLDYLESIQLLRRAEEKGYVLQKDLILANKEYNNLIR